MPTTQQDATRLAPGQFLGTRLSSARFGPFAVSLLVPTVPSHEVVTHSHAEAHFVLVLAGLYHSAARDWRMGAGMPALIFNPVGTTHRDRFEHCEGARFLTIGIDDRAAAAIESPSASLRSNEPRTLPQHGAALAERLASHLSDWDDSARLTAESVCLELLGMAMHAPHRRVGGGPAWIEVVCDRLREMEAPALGITSLARSLGLHPVYLAREFRRAIGCSPGDYLRHHRCERAAALLSSTRLPLAEIALQCGFADQSHLTRRFKAAFGVAPSAYRARRGGRVACVQDLTRRHH